MSRYKKVLTLSEQEAYVKITAYCAYRDRSRLEVTDKLYGYGIDKDTTAKILIRLEKEKFLDESRYAKNFAGGKFRVRNWGKNRIKQELRSKGVSEELIREGLDEITDQQYSESIAELIRKKEKSLKEPHPLKRKYKIAAYLIRKGYEPDKVWKELGGEEDSEQ